MDRESHPTAESLIAEIRATDKELAHGEFRNATRIQLAGRKAIDLLGAGKISADDANGYQQRGASKNAVLRRVTLGKRI